MSDPHDRSPPRDPAAAAAAAARLVHTSAVGTVRMVELRLPAVLDSDEFDALNDRLLNEVATVGAGRCVLDLAAVEYMGSSMLGLLVNARQKIKAAGGRLVLCGLSPWLVQTLHACSLEKLFTVVANRTEAVAAAGR
jgi:anti-anti-sigma factor